MKKIIIAGPGRCGSTLLLASLTSHPLLKERKCTEPLCYANNGYSYYHEYS